MLDKRALRREIAAQKRALSPAQIEAASADLTAQLLAHPLFRAARSLYAYLSYNQEVRTLPLIRQAQALGKRVAVPKVYGETDMRFLWLDDPARIAPGAYGIPEPVDDGPEADDPAALVLMPGLAFDPQGHRLGYGGGYYDRFLEKGFTCPRVGLCFEFQLVESLPLAPWDQRVNYICTEERMLCL